MPGPIVTSSQFANVVSQASQAFSLMPANTLSLLLTIGLAVVVGYIIISYILRV